jgi:transposase InsO family protein
MCQVLEVSRSGYYAWLSRPCSQRAVENQALTDRIRELHAQSHEIYGSPRITEELKAEQRVVSRPRVARLMKKAGIRSKIAKKYVATTDSKHNLPVMENLLDRQFHAGDTGQAWVSDITYIWTLIGWIYLTIILDLADRKVVGWALSTSLKAIDTVIPAWSMAVRNRRPKPGMIFHSDRGIQYACKEFAEVVRAWPLVKRSMSRKGNCWDNAPAESFFKSLKVEWIYGKILPNKEKAMTFIFEYIEIFYNRKRRHSTNGYKTPEEMETFIFEKKHTV